MRIIKTNQKLMRLMSQHMLAHAIAKAGVILTCILIALFAHDVRAQDCARRAMACNNRVNIPLNENCEVTITIDMILEDQVGADSDYELRIFDPQGNRIMSNTLREDYDCQPLKVEIECKASGLPCWGTIVIEDRIKPNLNIEPRDTVVFCNVYDFQRDLDALATRVIFSDQGSCQNPDSLGRTDFVLTQNDVCNDTVATILRSWTVVDKSKFKNDSTLVQTIYLLRAKFSDFEYPRDTTIDCRNAGNTTTAALGVPQLRSCDPYFNIIPSEETFTTCGGARKISRRWRIIDTCRDTDTIVTQSIEIIDTAKAIINFSSFSIPSDRFIPNQEECTASVTAIANPRITDCSSIQRHQLRAWYQFADANGMPFGFRFDAFVNSVETFDLRDVPIGQDFVVIFEVTDSCGNISTGTSGVFKAQDNTEPNAVCESSTIVGITSSGLTEVTAASLDDHSFDNCGIVRREIRRMNSSCSGFNSDRIFGNSVHFCCEDVANNPIKVLLRVYDAAGNSSDCIIDVIVQDKRNPIIACPSNLSLNCNTDVTNLESIIRARGLPTVTWVCGQRDLRLTVPNVSISACGFASFSVTWTATDVNGTSAICRQQITIDDITGVNTSPPPSEVIVSNCNGGITPEDLQGSSPVVNGADCEELAITYEDLPFVLNDNDDNYCRKIQRNWTIIDWCAFNNGNITNATIATYEQFILIRDNQAPRFSNLPDDFETIDVDGDCSEQISITVSATDDCSSQADIVYGYDIDIDGDGVGDDAGDGNVMSRSFGTGSYSVVFSATDQCGNVQMSNPISFEIGSTKQPVPIIVGTYAINLQSNGSVSLLASDLNIKSTNGCSDSEDGLFYAFSSDPNEAIRTFTCTDIPNGVSTVLEVPIFVIDERGNFNSADVDISLSDVNFDACANDTSQVTIRGSVTDQNLQGVANIAVSTFSPATNQFLEVMTDENGNYVLNDLHSYEDYAIEAHLEGFDLTGVTTLDIVLIERHILGIAALESPYKLIAADINNSASISAADIAELRKLILGIRSTLGQNNSWKFIDKTYEFPNTLGPWDYPEMSEVTNLLSDANNIDFIGLKVGDVNGNAFGALAQEMAGVRSISQYNLHKNVREDEVIFSIVPTAEKIYGLQMSLSLVGPDMELVSVTGLNITAQNYTVVHDQLNISWSSATSVLARPDAPIVLTFRTTNPHTARLMLNNEGFANEYYNNAFETKEIKLIEKQQEDTSLKLEQNVPNPFVQKTQIQFTLHSRGEAKFEVIDMNGRLIYTQTQTFDVGKNTLMLNADDLNGNGVYYYTITAAGQKETRRMVIIN